MPRVAFVQRSVTEPTPVRRADCVVMGRGSLALYEYHPIRCDLGTLTADSLDAGGKMLLGLEPQWGCLA